MLPRKMQELKSQRRAEYKKALSALKPVGRLELDGTSLSLKYSYDKPTLLCASCENGLVHVVDITKIVPKRTTPFIPETIKPLLTASIHMSPIFDIDWHDASSKLLTAAGDMTISIFDMERITQTKYLHKHTKSVRSVASCKSNPNLIASGGRDGDLYLWDLRQTYSDYSQENATAIEVSMPELNSFTGVSFYGDEHTLLTTQSNIEFIKVWDLRKYEKVKGDIKKRLDRLSADYRLNKRPLLSTKNPLCAYQINEYTAYLSRFQKLKETIDHFRENPADPSVIPMFRYISH
eukprot:TRINITY_DN1968_c0_g1_i14.p1 TRINITY_DN1968_c0_g1~~TRINITY_DN1968_c0_g1_i14.p1  ORF type:complete len:292 (+),score=38.71 TRINITY_DN1968_c0_g1_i14:69-944(+)